MSTPTHTHDVVAIGLGPFNLGLAALTDPIEELDCVFLDRRDGFDWHPGMMLETATVQTPFLADLVTLADPTSPLSFLSYLKQAGHLYSFYIRETFQPLRSEFNAYCQWVAEQLSTLRWGREVEAVTYDADADEYVVEAVVKGERTERRETYRARHLVLGTGTPPHIPPGVDPLPGDAVHSSGYLPARDELVGKRSVAVVGGGQSAAEIFLDLLEGIDEHGYALTWITRSPRFFPLDYTKLTLEMTSPEYVDYFHDLPAGVRDDLVREQAILYKGIDSELIDEIFHTLYRKHRRGRPMARLLTNTELVGATHEDGCFALELHQTEADERFSVSSEGLVLATGYRQQVPEFLDGVRDRIAWDDRGRYDVARDYTIDAAREGRIFVQNGELHTHGFTAPDLGMACYRNSCIIRSLLGGREVYAVERAIAMQEFGVPGRAAATAGVR
ncbi:MAG TPA: lysine N(6)-hydroxylase/L-ornithine N(5)-oxygenase family protein [Solirubrobacteraceae bacterium]|nr:lysine N(6)-hydroxylase/L-ornithine N(5)-oxygenase family protein [Solirubrobacteraceae bacterium]